jgi:hypothetical protein
MGAMEHLVEELGAALPDAQPVTNEQEDENEHKVNRVQQKMALIDRSNIEQRLQNGN